MARTRDPAENAPRFRRLVLWHLVRCRVWRLYGVSPESAGPPRWLGRKVRGWG